MSISPGMRIGAYEVTSKIGQGGMGVVYRARDTRLQRDVALKLLPDHFAADPERLARFQREAQVLASLNHPNIAQIYGLEQISSGCIVMELVEGETLADRIERGRVPVDDAIAISQQIVDALEAAHERDVVHRDLKPANIKLTPDGNVKVLDFGLAKALSGSGTEADASNSPTIMTGSMPGVVMGTAAYMSPEQARGRHVDARTDIWAFGCILYEMLTGHQVFAGETATDSIAKIIGGQPDWTLLPDNTPASVRVLLNLLLKKELRERLQHIGDARLFFKPEIFADLPAAMNARVSGRRRTWIVAGALGVALAATLIVGGGYFRNVPADAQAIHYEMPAPAALSDLIISPDSQNLAYVVSAEGQSEIRIQPLGSLTARSLPGTENARSLFWAPDNGRLAFLSGGKWMKIDVTSGISEMFYDASSTPFSRISAPASWSRDGVILFTDFIHGTRDFIGLAQISANGGNLTPITSATLSGKELFHFAPAFLSDGRRFLFHAGDVPGFRQEKVALYVGSLDSKSTTRLMEIGVLDQSQGNSPVSYVPGYLLFVRNRALMAQRFDEEHLQFLGEPVALAENVRQFAASATGALVYRRATDLRSSVPRQQLVWFDRNGRPVGEVASSAMYQAPRLSRDGRRLAVAISESGDGRWDVWIMDLARNSASQLTFDPGGDSVPVWSPDGTQIVFASSRGTNTPVPAKIYQKASNGAGTDRLLFEPADGEAAMPLDWSPDGENIIFFRQPSNTVLLSDLWILPLSGGKKPFPYLQGSYRRSHAQFSPDGRWIAYTSNETGIANIVVQPFPDATQGKWRLSVNGGVEPRWRRDGRELFYLALDGKMMAVPITSGSSFESGQPVTLFQTRLSADRTNITPVFRYDVSGDGQRFLITAPAPAADAKSAVVPLNVVLNWTAGLKKK